MDFCYQRAILNTGASDYETVTKSAHWMNANRTILRGRLGTALGRSPQAVQRPCPQNAPPGEAGVLMWTAISAGGVALLRLLQLSKWPEWQGGNTSRRKSGPKGCLFGLDRPAASPEPVSECQPDAPGARGLMPVQWGHLARPTEKHPGPSSKSNPEETFDMAALRKNLVHYGNYSF